MRLFYMFLSTVLYYQLDSIVNDLIFPKNEKNNIIVHDQVRDTFYFSFILFTFFLIYSLYRYHKNKMVHNIYISLIYLRYSSIIFFRSDISHLHQEIRKILMWIFTTPVMLNMLSNINKIDFFSLKPQLHLMNTFIYLILSFFPDSSFYKWSKPLLYASNAYFIYNLNQFTYYRYTRIFVGIWIIFGVIVLLKDASFITDNNYFLFNLISDILAKFTVVNLISEFEDQREEISAQMDIQSLQLITDLLKKIDEFKESNKISKVCEKTMNYLVNNIKGLIPKKDNHDLLKIELLKKILPYDLEDRYLLSNVNRYTKHDNICVLFTDIVSYSKISHEYDEQVIYQLLNEIYIRFDFLLRKYKNLQKIETIGDSYMVVGDLTNMISIEEVIPSMINFAFDLLESISLIQTPNKEKLQIRIGIHNGPIVVGILGLDIPRLCVVGNTVNTTSRLESTSKPDRIQISESIFKYIENNEFYKCKERNNIHLKNIGTMNTYFIYKNIDGLYLDESPIQSALAEEENSKED